MVCNANLIVGLVVEKLILTVLQSQFEYTNLSMVLAIETLIKMCKYANPQHFWSSTLLQVSFVGPKVWSSTPDCIKSSATFTFKWQLTKHPLHEKDT